MSTRKPTAKERTVNMPGVDVREQENRVAPIVILDGPRLRRVTGKGFPPAMHFAADHGMPALCGVQTVKAPEDRADGLRETCQRCRAEASRLRAVVRR